jgi:hypothetical protein
MTTRMTMLRIAREWLSTIGAPTTQLVELERRSPTTNPADAVLYDTLLELLGRVESAAQRAETELAALSTSRADRLSFHDEVTQRFLAPLAACNCAAAHPPCLDKLNSTQAEVLDSLTTMAPGEIKRVQVPVGYGRSVISILAPLAVPSERALLLINPAERLHLETLHQRLSAHFRVPTFLQLAEVGILRGGAPVLTMCSHTRVSAADGRELLDAISPDFIIMHEMHEQSPSSVRAGRITRYLAEHPQTRVLIWIL